MIEAAKLLIAAQGKAAELLAAQADANASSGVSAQQEAAALLRREAAAAVALLQEHDAEQVNALVAAQREAPAILLEAGIQTREGRDVRPKS